MKLPPVKKLTAKQAAKYYRAIETVYPEVLKGMNEHADAVMERKLTKREQEIQTARMDGYRDGIHEGQAAVERQKKEFAAARASTAHRIAALQEATKFLSVAGQTLGEFARAMASEAGQL